MQYRLKANESQQTLLQDKHNSINYYQADYNNIRPQLDNYDVIVADVREKDGGDELLHVTKRLKTGGLLILGSIDDVNVTSYGGKHSLAVLGSHYDAVEREGTVNGELIFLIIVI